MVERYDAGPYHGWRRFGKNVLASSPKGIVVVSAHWENHDQSCPGVIINTNVLNPIVYDFYGFPKRYCQFQFHSRAEPSLQNEVIKALKEGGVNVSSEDRGLDHGVWIPFRAAFGDEIEFPLVQVSLPASSDPRESIKLGQALSKLRNQGYSIVTTGHIIHNLRDVFSGKGMPYNEPFMKAISSALSSSDPIASTLNLMQQPMYKNAHPTDEHFYPLLVAIGATWPDDKCEVIYQGMVDIYGKDVEEGGLGWGMWQWTS
nr:extradiol ring-cleavage dioxygenase [Cryptococcus depauperatus CBS 7855]